MKKILSILTACAVLLCLSGCNSQPAGDNTGTTVTVSDTTVSETTEEIPVITPEEVHPASLSSMTCTFDESGAVSISRYTPEENAPMGAEGTWTVFVYMCGGGLEEQHGMASADIEEMLEASKNSGIKFAVQTGGTKAWENSEINPSLTQRFIISGGEMTLDDEQAEINMGESSSLSAFLEWGTANHSAEKMGVVLWGKGGGTAAGVCFDENYGGDSLSLREIDAALLTVYEKMTDKFEFIGFDASLMSSLEAANILATYAEYMYGSQEIQPCVSWDYTAFGACLGENPAAEGLAVGTAVADYYIKACEGTLAESLASFSVVKLSEIDSLISAYNTYCQMLYAMTEEEVIRAEVSRGMEKIESFGGNNAAEGYTNLVDLIGTVDASPEYFLGKNEVRTALSNAVLCVRNGEAHGGACGLSVYYPTSVNTAAELFAFASAAVSPYQLSFIDRYVHSVYSSGDSEYTNAELMKMWGNFSYSFENYYSSTVYEDYEYTYTEEFYDDYYIYTENYEAGEYWGYADFCSIDGISGHISFEEDPQTDDNGRFYFTLADDSRSLADKVEGYVYKLSEEGDELYDLGVYTGVECNWTDNMFCDNYDGKHLTLSDGQELALYPMGKTETSELYSSPVLLNGEEANLRIAYSRETDTAEILGVWSGMDDYGCPETGASVLAAGDIIVPVYYTYDVFSDEEYYTEGEECEYDGSGELSIALLDSGDYCFGFYISDVFGNYYATDYEYFSIEEGALTFA